MKLHAALLAAQKPVDRAKAAGVPLKEPGRISEEVLQAPFREGPVHAAIAAKCEALIQALQSLGFERRAFSPLSMDLKQSSVQTVRVACSADFYDTCQEREVFLWLSLYVYVNGPDLGRFRFRGQVVRMSTPEERLAKPLVVADVMVDKYLIDSGVPLMLGGASTSQDVVDFALNVLEHKVGNWEEVANEFASSVDEAILP